MSPSCKSAEDVLVLYEFVYKQIFLSIWRHPFLIQISAIGFDRNVRINTNRTHHNDRAKLEKHQKIKLHTLLCARIK